MKRLCLLLGMVLLIANLSFAQTPRGSNQVRSEGKSRYTNLAVTGLDVTGVPGYIELMSSSGRRGYLYLDDSFRLRLASDATVSNSAASPQTTDWSNAGIVVGEQAASTGGS